MLHVKHRSPRLLLPLALALTSAVAPACRRAASSPTPGAATTIPGSERKVGVLLVNHGSRSATWRQTLLDLEARVRGPLLEGGAIREVKTAFMEYTEPSIATRMKELDAGGYTDVVVVPIFLTVSPHPFDDIPTILGLKQDPHAVESLKIEHIERYTARARVHVTPLLDFPDVLQRNLVRRVKRLSQTPAEEGVALIAYGDETYEKEWSALLERAGAELTRATGITVHAHGWCGHVAHYDPAMTTAAIETVLAKRKKAIVVPVLVAHDEMFQVRIIGDGIARVPGHRERVIYRPDSILPDEGVERWVVSTAREHAARAQAMASR